MKNMKLKEVNADEGKLELGKGKKKKGLKFEKVV